MRFQFTQLNPFSLPYHCVFPRLAPTSMSTAAGTVFAAATFIAVFIDNHFLCGIHGADCEVRCRNPGGQPEILNRFCCQMIFGTMRTYIVLEGGGSMTGRRPGWVSGLWKNEMPMHPAWRDQLGADPV